MLNINRVCRYLGEYEAGTWAEIAREGGEKEEILAIEKDDKKEKT